jgi:hypothetical protein
LLASGNALMQSLRVFRRKFSPMDRTTGYLLRFVFDEQIAVPFAAASDRIHCEHEHCSPREP